MALNKSMAAESDVINIFEAEGARKVVMGISPKKAAHILNRLIDTYTKPKDATVREVVSNATDATVLLPPHLRKPIEITCPSTFKPSLTVRDFGVGMTPEIVEHVYVQFGESTKEDDFSQIGAFGLGAKAPLSYCKEFSVMTTRDGVTTDVLISRNSDGPAAKILSVRKTDEPNGTVVTIPVRMEDRQDFVNALEPYRKYSFDTELNIDGVISKRNENYVDFDKVYLDEESKTEGRVWVNKNSLIRLLTNSFNPSNYGYSYRDFVSTRYSLSGWIYADPEVNNDSYYSRNNTEYDVIVELKPGIVDFSTSRDEITKNDRSKILSETTRTAITKNPEYLFKNIMKSYSELTDREAYKLASELIDLINPRKTDKKTVFLGKDKIQMSFDIEEFNTKTGFNPLKVILNRHEKNVLAIAYYGREYSILKDNLPNQKAELLASKPENEMFYTSRAWSNGSDSRVGTLNAHIADLVEAGKLNESLVDFVAEKARVYSDKDIFNIVTSVDAEKIKKINARRKILSDKIFVNEYAFYTDLDEISQDQIDLAEKIANVKMKFITADDLIEKANEIRKEIAKANPKTSANTSVLLTKVDTAGLTTQAEVIKKFNSHGASGESVLISLEDLMDDDSLIVIGDTRNHRQTLIGAANANIQITNRDIYITGYQSGLRAPHFTKLKDYEGVIVSSNYSYNSMAFTEISKRASYHEIALNEEVAALPDAKIVSMYILSHQRYCSPAFMKFLAASTSSDSDHDLINLLVAGSQLDEYPAFSVEFIFKELVKRIGEDDARKIKSFMAVSSSFRSGSFTDASVTSLIRFGSTIAVDDKLALQIRDVFIDRWRNKTDEIIQGEQDALKAAAEVVDAVELTEVNS